MRYEVEIRATTTNDPHFAGGTAPTIKSFVGESGAWVAEHGRKDVLSGADVVIELNFEHLQDLPLDTPVLVIIRPVPENDEERELHRAKLRDSLAGVKLDGPVDLGGGPPAASSSS